MGKCTSQQATEQNTRPVRLRVHVDTLHTQWIVEKSISFLQLLQRFQRLVSSADMTRFSHNPRALTANSG